MIRDARTTNHRVTMGREQMGIARAKRLWGSRWLASPCLAMALCVSLPTAFVTGQELTPLQRLEQALGLGQKSDAAPQQDDQQKTRNDRQGQETLPPPLLLGPKQTGDLQTPPPMQRISPDDLPRDLGDLKPYLGVRTADLTSSVARELGMKSVTGALLQEVVPDSPADKAGLEPGMVVVSIDGHRVDRGADLEMQIARKRPGEEVMLLYYQGTKLSRAEFLLGGIEPAALQEPNDIIPIPEPSPNPGAVEALTPRRGGEQPPANTGGPPSNSNDLAAGQNDRNERRGRLLRRLIDPDREGPLRILGRLPLDDDNNGGDNDDQNQNNVNDTTAHSPNEANPAANPFNASAPPLPVEGQLPTEAQPSVDMGQLVQILNQQQQQIAELQRRIMELERRLAESQVDRNR